MAEAVITRGDRAGYWVRVEFTREVDSSWFPATTLALPFTSHPRFAWTLRGARSLAQRMLADHLLRENRRAFSETVVLKTEGGQA